MSVWWHAAVVAVGGSIALVGVVVVGIVAWNRQRDRVRLRSVERRPMPSPDS
jgi:hypothetical protein